MALALGHLWALPLTLAGAGHALLLGARPLGLRDGAVDFVAPRRGPLAWFFRRSGVHAYTWGAAIVYADEGLTCDDALSCHERVHVKQCLVLGPLMPVAYVASSLWQVIRGRRAYRDNWFEVAARAATERAASGRSAAS